MPSTLIAGLDEVGRGSLAGPLLVVVAAYNVNQEPIKGVDDSKKLSKKSRRELAPKLAKEAKYLGFGWAPPGLIDSIGISKAWQIACDEALFGAPEFENLIVDGNIRVRNYTGRQDVIVRADGSIWQVSAASVIAKECRDLDMRSMADFYKGYGWETNAGYGTKKHMEAIKKLGACTYHRRTFLPT